MSCADIYTRCHQPISHLCAAYQVPAHIKMLGDFAAVKRLAKFSPLKNANDFYERLCEEVKIKDLQGANAKAGFSV